MDGDDRGKPAPHTDPHQRRKVGEVASRHEIVEDLPVRPIPTNHKQPVGQVAHSRGLLRPHGPSGGYDREDIYGPGGRARRAPLASSRPPVTVFPWRLVSG